MSSTSRSTETSSPTHRMSRRPPGETEAISVWRTVKTSPLPIFRSNGRKGVALNRDLMASVIIQASIWARCEHPVRDVRRSPVRCGIKPTPRSPALRCRPCFPYHPTVPRTDRSSPLPADARPDEDAADRALVRAIRAGRSEAWNDLVRRYQDRVFTLCLRMVNNDRDLAADLSQDAFLRIIRGLDTFDDRARLSTWVYRVTMNSCLSRLRQEKLRRHASLDAPQNTNDGSPGPSRSQTREPPPGSRVQTVDERERLLDALGVLSDEHRAILILRDSRGLEYEQIAETLDIPVGTVRSRLFRARAALRNELESPRGGKEHT